MSLSRRWIWALVAAAFILLILPIPIAERYSSPTQDGQYATSPLRAYRFVFAAARVSPSSELNTSGEALDRAKRVYRDSAYVPTKVELLFLPGDEEYQYTTRSGQTLRFREEGSFVWEVWGELGEDHTASPSTDTPTSQTDDSINGTAEGTESTESTEGEAGDAGARDGAGHDGVDVIGFLDYATGEVLETLDEPGAN